jgi:hypothetical protein
MFAVVGTKGPAARFNKLQEEEVLRFLLRAIDEPEKVMEHAKTWVLKIAALSKDKTNRLTVTL